MTNIIIFTILNTFLLVLCLISFILFMVFCYKGIRAFNIYIANNTIDKGE